MNYFRNFGSAHKNCILYLYTLAKNFSLPPVSRYGTGQRYLCSVNDETKK